MSINPIETLKILHVPTEISPLDDKIMSSSEYKSRETSPLVQHVPVEVLSPAPAEVFPLAIAEASPSPLG